MSDDRRFEPDHIYDLPPLSPSADHLELLEHQQREDQWRRTREPVAAGSKFLKFLTWQDLVNLKLVTEEQVIGSDDPSKPDEPGGPGDDEIDDARVYAYARDFDPSTNDGASSPLVISFGAGKPDAKVIAFDPAVNESAEIQLILPPEWPGKSLQCRIYWSHPLATSWGVVWEVQAHSAKDGENMAVDYVPGMVAVDEGGNTNHLYISASNVVTIETGNAMPGDLVFIKVIRRTDHADDTLNADAYFHAIEFLVGNSPAEFPPIVGTDEYWDSVILLLKGEGTSGSTTFTDSSKYSQSLSIAGGSPQLSSAQFKFGSSSITGGSNARLAYTPGLEGSADDWTVEFWFRRTPGSYPFGVDFPNNFVLIGSSVDGAGRENKLLANTYTYEAQSTTTLSVDTWYHCAVTREIRQADSITRVFVNGVLEGSRVDGMAAMTGGFAWQIGRHDSAGFAGIQGHVDNLRITAGVCRYKADFTVPTEDFPEASAGAYLSVRRPTALTTFSSDRRTFTFSPASSSFECTYARSAKARTGGVYWEVKIDGPATRGYHIGVVAQTEWAGPPFAYPLNCYGESVWAICNGNVFGMQIGLITNGTGSANGAYDFTVGDVIGVFFKNGKLWFSKNGTWLAGDPATETGPTFSGLSDNVDPYITCYGASVTFGITANLRREHFQYTPSFAHIAL